MAESHESTIFRTAPLTNGVGIKKKRKQERKPFGTRIDRVNACVLFLQALVEQDCPYRSLLAPISRLHLYG